MVKRWFDAYEAAGKTGLRKRKRHNVKKKDIPEPLMLPPDSVLKLPEDLSYDELLAELRYRRAEMDYLKKLKALAQQKKKQK